ncbi:MAG TPA: FliM/FliN family flagellar motor switch protein [Terracidiphilus sp.]|nr:FliM/FliN family flagellar motor switch protein [Terracidiphilus sp.]
MSNYLECWVSVATALFSQALAGEPALSEGLPKPMAAGSFGFAAVLSGDHEGRFSVVLDQGVLETPFLGEGVEQKAAWAELLREVAEAAAGDLLASTGAKCRVEAFEEIASTKQVSRAFQLKSAAGAWAILVRDETHPRKAETQTPQPEAGSASAPPEPGAAPSARSPEPQPVAAISSGIELLLDVELEATLRFGCRELPLGEILDLGPGDVVELDRHVADPVDLIVGDKIVARGEVVLVNGNFGLRVTEVAAPRKRLESIRCLF